MDLRPLGSTGLRVSPLGLGTVKLGRNQGVKYPHPFSLPSDREALTLLDLAWESGINLLDTAPAYGEAEERLGKLLQAARRDWLISTKVGEAFSAGQSRFDFSAAATRASVERSLKRLRRERLDVVLIHSDGDDIRALEQEDCLAALLELKAAGLIRAIGLSAKTVVGGLHALAHCDLVMVAYNPLYSDELPVIRAARAAGKGVLIKKGLASGHLDRFGGADPVATSLRLLLAEPGVSSVVVGTLNPEHLRENVRIARRVLGGAG
ncbi:MAG: aldo/keto reductase [Gammaproteobacteria bacterium]